MKGGRVAEMTGIPCNISREEDSYSPCKIFVTKWVSWETALLSLLHLLLLLMISVVIFHLALQGPGARGAGLWVMVRNGKAESFTRRLDEIDM